MESRTQDIVTGQSGIRFEDIVIDYKLDKGAVSKVYLGRYFTTKYAVKIMRDDTDPRFEKEFNKEVKIFSILTELQAPNIIRFVSAGTSPHNYIILEYMRNGSLDAYLFSKIALTLETKYNFMREITVAINFLHQHQIIHRDIKPLNVLLSDDVHAKLCDFGTAIGFDEIDLDPAGTLDYLAPETMKSQQYSDKIDVYSMGITFWEIMSRKEIFSKVSSDTAILKLKETGCPEKIPKSCPSVVKNLIKWCWQVKPKNRPNAAQVLNEIDKLTAPVVHHHYPRSGPKD